jgi:Bacterial membrane protein YfhO
MKSPQGGWSPNYMMGGTLLIHYATAVASMVSIVISESLSWLVGSFAAQKILILSFLPASALAMWFFARTLGTSRSLSAWISLVYITLPSFHVAVGIYEHWTVGLCFVFTPLILRGIVTVAEEGSPREIVGLGLAAAALALSYTKIAVVMSPMLALWTLEVLRLNRPNIRRALIGYGFSILVAFAAAVMILLPASREFGFAAGFLFDPLDGWKHHYAFKTPLLWIDLWGFLTRGSPELMGDAAMFQIGLIPLAALSFALSLSSLAEWRATQLGRWFLILTGCWLLSIWFASGPDGILLGHINTLKTSQGIPDTSIPLLWISLVWIGWLIYRTAFQLLPKNTWVPALITLIVLAVPVFRIAEFFPLFKDIRAPESFWSVGGFCCLAAAVGMAFWMLFTEVIGEGWRKPLAIAVGLLMLVELYPIHSAYWTRGMDRQLFTEYDQAASFLKTAPIQGRVHPLSGRYFYLTLPEKAGRALDSEALLRHFQLKWVRHLEVAGNASGDAIRSYMNLAGVAYILLDKEDPFSPKQMQDFFRSVYPVAFENRYFAVLANPDALYPAFLAKDFVALPPESYAMAPATLQLLPQNLITVEMGGVDRNMPGFAGMAKGPNQIELLQQYQGKAGQSFGRVPLVGNRMDDYQRMSYQIPPTVSGWLVVSEAYHPDWTVTIDGKAAEVHRAEAALLSAFVPPGSHEVTFQFKAPAWYSLCLALGTLSWIVALAALFYLPSKWAPAKWRQWWVGNGS